MQDPNEQVLETASAPMQAPRRPVWHRIFNVLICLIILCAGALAAVYVGKKAPKARKRPPERMHALVQVKHVAPADHQVTVRAMGTVVAAREMVLRSQVAGAVVSTHPELIEGGFFKTGVQVLQIDPRDYTLAVARKKSAVTSALYALKLEMGHQAVARREWNLLNGGKTADSADVELALRKPHLAKAQADLAAAEAELEQAELDLERTRIRAPFNTMVRSVHVQVGSRVSTQDTLAELVGTDAYHIRVSVPSDRLQWIDVPGRGHRSATAVRIFYRNGVQRTGTVFKLLSDLEPDGRMARVLVKVDDPLGLNGRKNDLPPLLIGEYVRVEIAGKTLRDVFEIPRTALRDNTGVWVAADGDTLEIRRVETVWRGEQIVVLRNGLAPGDRLIVSDLPAPVAGMPLRIAEPDGRESLDRPASRSPEKG